MKRMRRSQNIYKQETEKNHILKMDLSLLLLTPDTYKFLYILSRMCPVAVEGPEQSGSASLNKGTFQLLNDNSFR